jgi:hypothetical protein
MKSVLTSSPARLQAFAPDLNLMGSDEEYEKTVRPADRLCSSVAGVAHACAALCVVQDDEVVQGLPFKLAPRVTKAGGCGICQASPLHVVDDTSGCLLQTASGIRPP